MLITAEDAIDVAHSAANRWTGHIFANELP